MSIIVPGLPFGDGMNVLNKYHPESKATMNGKKSKRSNMFEVVGRLGKGAFAVVLKVRDEHGNTFALKKPFHNSDSVKSATGIINLKELYILGFMKHPYIQKAEVIYFDDPCPNDGILLEDGSKYERIFFLMTEANYTCHELIHSYKAPISHFKRAMFQAVCAVYHLHAHGIAHRDIKPGNLLCYYTKNGVLNVKLTDFGMTKPFNNVGQNSCHAGTSYYKAPEILLEDNHYKLSADIWSLACTMIEMVTKKILFKHDTVLSLINAIFSFRGSPNQNMFDRISKGCSKLNISINPSKPVPIRTILGLGTIDIQNFDARVVDNLYSPGSYADFCDLMEKMLVVDPDGRLTIDQVIGHRFFADQFVEHPNDYELWRPNIRKGKYSMRRIMRKGRKVIQVFPRAHEQMWHHGVSVFVNIACHEIFDRCDNEQQWAIRFHGLDLYNRILLMIEPMPTELHYRQLAWCCGYIISKFYLDEASYHMYDIFPESSMFMSLKEIALMERLILETVSFEVYKPTCLTFLEQRTFYACLFALMTKPNFMYNRPIGVIMDMFNTNARMMLASDPNMAMIRID